MARPKTRSMVKDDANGWGWRLGRMAFTPEHTSEYFRHWCKEVMRDDRDRVDRIFFGAEGALFGAQQRQLHTCIEAAVFPPGEPRLLALLGSRFPEVGLQWCRAFWAMYGADVALEAMRLWARTRWVDQGDCAVAHEAAPIPFGWETVFLRGLANCLPPAEREALRRRFVDPPGAVVAGELRFWMEVFPGAFWADRIEASAPDERRCAAARIASMVADAADARAWLEQAHPVEPDEVEGLLVNLVATHGNKVACGLLASLMARQPELVPALAEALPDLLVSVEACALVAHAPAGRDYLVQHPDHALAALERLPDADPALIEALKRLPRVVPTAPDAPYLSLEWEVIDDGVTGHGLPDWASGAVPLTLPIHSDLVRQLRDDEPRAALDRLLSGQRETLTYLVTHWAEVEDAVRPHLAEMEASVLAIVVHDEDEPLCYGVSATSPRDDEHGVGIRMRGLEVIERGTMNLVL